MQFKTVIKNNLKETRRLVWLGGKTIDGEGILVLDNKCLPIQLMPPEAKSMLGELHAGAITVTYVTDIPTVKEAELDNLFKTLSATTTTVEPVKTVEEKFEKPIPADTSKKATKELGKVAVDAEDKSDTLANSLAIEGSMEDFEPARVAFTEADKEAIADFPKLQEAFEEPAKQPDKFSKPVKTESLFETSEAPSAEKSRRRTRKEM